MDMIIISIVGRNPDGVVNATETKVFYKGQRIDSKDSDWSKLRENQSLAVRQLSKEILQGGKDVSTT